MKRRENKSGKPRFGAVGRAFEAISAGIAACSRGGLDVSVALDFLVRGIIMAKLVTVYGGSGFVGRYIVRRMALA